METTVIEWTPKAKAVLTAAAELFYSSGIHAVGVDAIAQRAGVTKKTLYDRFGSKERLVVEYLTARDTEWRDYLAARLETVGKTAEDRLRGVFAASASWAEQHGGKGCSMINAHAEISDASHPAYAVIIGQKQWMLELFGEIAAAAIPPAPDGKDERARALNRDEVATAIMLLHEGALVAAGVGVIPGAYATARDTALALLRAPQGRSR